MNRTLYVFSLAATMVITVGCGKDADDTASDEASAMTAKASNKLPPGTSPFGAAATPNGKPAGGLNSSGPPTSAPPQMIPGQGMGSILGKAPANKDLTKDEDLPK